MEILSFQKFKLLLEAEETQDPAQVDGAPVEDETEPLDNQEPPVDSTQTDTQTSTSTPTSTSSGIPTDPFASATLPPDPNQPIPQANSTEIKFVMLDPDKEWHSEYDDGGGVRRFSEYEVTQSDLDKWIEDNGLSAEKDKIIKAFKGDIGLSRELFDKLKKSLNSEELGKNLGDLDIEYDEKDDPSTGELEVVFIKKAD